MFRLLHDRSQAGKLDRRSRLRQRSLDAELRKDGIEMIAPHRGNRSKPRTQDRRRLSRYMRRWLVERFFAWIQWQRRSSFAGSTTPTISLALSSLPALLSSSNNFEIGSIVSV